MFWPPWIILENGQRRMPYQTKRQRLLQMLWWRARLPRLGRLKSYTATREETSKQVCSLLCMTVWACKRLELQLYTLRVMDWSNGQHNPGKTTRHPHCRTSA